jgi:hypothetical protein
VLASFALAVYVLDRIRKVLWTKTRKERPPQ